MISKADCSTLKGAQQLIDDSNKLGPVGGVFNLAAVSNFNYFSRYMEMIQVPVVYYIKCIGFVTLKTIYIVYFQIILCFYLYKHL